MGTDQINMMLTCYAKFAEEESLSISKNCNWRIQKNMENGVYHLQVSHMLGYQYDNNKNIIIYEPEAKWVRIIYEMYVEDYSITAICDYLNKNNVKTVMGKKWTANAIHSILVNEKYVGDCLLQKTFVNNSLSHKKIINAGQKPQYLIQNGHPAIVDRSLWNAAQEKRNNYVKKYNLKTSKDEGYVKPTGDTRFSKFGYCPYCKKNYILKTAYYNYREPIRKMICVSNKYTTVCHESESLFINTLESIIIEQLNTLNNNRAYFKTALTKAFSNDEETNSKEKLKALESEITSLRGRYRELASSFSEYHEAIKTELLNEISDLVKDRNTLQNKILTMETADEKASEIIKELKEIPENLESLENIDFKKILKRLIVINRNQLVFIVGSDDISNLPNSFETIFNSTFQYRIRKTYYTCSFGIYINK